MAAELLRNMRHIVKRISMGLPNIFLTTLNTAVSLVLLSLEQYEELDGNIKRREK